MRVRFRWRWRQALLLGTWLATATAWAEPAPMRVAVDATDWQHRLFSVRQQLAVQPGPLTLWLPRWLPGTHSASADASRLAGLQVLAAGRLLAWQRDALDPFAFKLEVPAGVRELTLTFQHLSPTLPALGRVVMTPAMLNLQWQGLLLYPAGTPARELPVEASVTLPAGWQFGSALRSERREGDTTTFAPVSLEMLVDSPLFAGRHFRRVALEPDTAPRPVVLNLVADSDEGLRASEAQIEAHRQLLRQADRLFGTRHFAHYDFLLALSEELGPIGLEHHQSSENGVDPRYFEGWDKAVGSRELLAHEYVHSWNGKYRRPADLLTPDFNVPMRNSLLWVYEGQTEFWGHVLAARSGLTTPELARDRLAQHAAAMERRAGRAWRNLQDTTQDNLMGARGRPKDWASWQRGSNDYYVESLLVWLEVDALIREASGSRRSLDDFARLFFGGDEGQLGPRPYTFDDVVAALHAVQPHDWASLLRERLDSHGPGAPLEGLARAGWRLAYSDTPSENFRAGEARAKLNDFADSLGLRIGPEGRLAEVLWDSPAFQAGLTMASTLVAVNMRAYTPEVLKAAIVANQGGQAPIELLVREGTRFRQVRIDWRGGLRYPRLERIPGSPDRLSALYAPR